MNNRERGTKNVARFRELLERLDYEVETARAVVVWIPNGKGGVRPISKHEDFFGTYDIIAMKPGSKVLLVQVTTLADSTHEHLASERRQKIDAQPTSHAHTLSLVVGFRPDHSIIVLTNYSPFSWNRNEITGRLLTDRAVTLSSILQEWGASI